MDLYIHRVCSKLRKKVRLLGRLLSSVPNEILKLFIIHVLSQQYIIDLLCEILHHPNLFANFKVFKIVHLELLLEVGIGVYDVYYNKMR